MQYFTLGSAHQKTVNGVNCTPNHVIRIPGDYAEARTKMVELFGNRWSFQYDSMEGKMQYFPKGFIDYEDLVKGA